MVPWVKGPSIFNGHDKDDVRFVLDNDVDHEQVLKPLQGHGLSVVPLPEHLRNRPDHEVRAWARQNTRMIVTHDQDDWYKRNFDAAENPGIVVIPRDQYGKVDLALVGATLNIMRGHRDIFDATVVEISPDGVLTVWNPNLDTGEIEPFSNRLSEDYTTFELWFDENDELGVAPTEERP